MVKVPVPSGPLVTVAPIVLGVLLAPRISPPEVAIDTPPATVTPPVKVLAPTSCNMPAPVLEMPPTGRESYWSDWTTQMSTTD